jgi:hypothetical protein
MAYLMTKTSFYEQLFHGWVSASTIDLTQWGMSGQSVQEITASLAGMENSAALGIGLGLVIAVLLVAFALRDRTFRRNINNPLGGVVVGAAVVGGWYLTGGALGQQVSEAVEWMDQKPMGVGVQSFTFINPMGETLYYALDPVMLTRMTFGVVAVFGVIVGSLLYAVARRKFSLVWFNSRGDFIKHLVGAVFMGVGGVLAMGCTIGQGVSGTSTLAIGSGLALGSIIFGSALTMKIQYYRMVYDEEATFMGAFLSSLVDMRLLPDALRRLETP